MADLDIAALRAYVEQCGPAGSYPRYATYPSFTIEQATALLDAAEERDALRREVATNRDQIKTLQDLIRGDLTPAGIEVAQWRAERDALRAQRDGLLAAGEQLLDTIARRDHSVGGALVLSNMKEIVRAIRAAKGQP